MQPSPQLSTNDTENKPYTLDELVVMWELVNNGRAGKQRTVKKQYSWASTSTHNVKEADWTVEDTQTFAKFVIHITETSTKPDTMKKFFKTFGTEPKIRLAEYSPLPEPVLYLLAKDPSTKVKTAVLNRDNLPEKVFVALADDDNYQFRRKVAAHRKTPAHLLQKIFDNIGNKPHPPQTSGNEGVLESSLAFNANTPDDIRRHYQHSSAPATVLAAVMNPNTTSIELADVWERTRFSVRTRNEIMHHRNVTVETINTHVNYYLSEAEKTPDSPTARTAHLKTVLAAFNCAVANPRTPAATRAQVLTWMKTQPVPSAPTVLEQWNILTDRLK